MCTLKYVFFEPDLDVKKQRFLCDNSMHREGRYYQTAKDFFSIDSCRPASILPEQL